jgi:hypothetical protein
MTGAVAIEFKAATFTADTVGITVGNGGAFALDQLMLLTIFGTIPFEAFNVSTHSILIYNTWSGASATGWIKIPLVAGGGGDPTINATNFSGAATISWSSNAGSQNQTLTPGDPITLTDFETH